MADQSERPHKRQKLETDDEPVYEKEEKSIMAPRPGCCGVPDKEIVLTSGDTLGKASDTIELGDLFEANVDHQMRNEKIALVADVVHRYNVDLSNPDGAPKTSLDEVAHQTVIAQHSIDNSLNPFLFGNLQLHMICCSLRRLPEDVKPQFKQTLREHLHKFYTEFLNRPYSDEEATKKIDAKFKILFSKVGEEDYVYVKNARDSAAQLRNKRKAEAAPSSSN